MKISTKGRYALRLLLDIAQNQQGGFVSLKEIAERQEVSKKYLEQIIPLLSRAELLRAAIRAATACAAHRRNIRSMRSCPWLRAGLRLSPVWISRKIPAPARRTA